jgi:hypothetical protein
MKAKLNLTRDGTKLTVVEEYAMKSEREVEELRAKLCEILDGDKTSKKMQEVGNASDLSGRSVSNFVLGKGNYLKGKAKATGAKLRKWVAKWEEEKADEVAEEAASSDAGMYRAPSPPSRYPLAAATSVAAVFQEGGLGLQLQRRGQAANSCIVVSAVTSGGQAEADGVRVGGVLNSVQGKLLPRLASGEALPTQEVVKVITAETRPFTLHFQRGAGAAAFSAAPTLTPEPEPTVEVVETGVEQENDEKEKQQQAQDQLKRLRARERVQRNQEKALLRRKQKQAKQQLAEEEVVEEEQQENDEKEKEKQPQVQEQQKRKRADVSVDHLKFERRVKERAERKQEMALLYPRLVKRPSRRPCTVPRPYYWDVHPDPEQEEEEEYSYSIMNKWTKQR